MPDRFISPSRRAVPVWARLLKALVSALLLAAAAAPAAMAAVGLWSHVGLGGMQVNAVVAGPGADPPVLAGTDGRGVFRATGGDRVFSAQNLGLENFTVNDVAFHPTVADLAFAATGRSPFIGEAVAGVHRSTDGGQTWNLVARMFAADIAISSANPDVIYAGGSPQVLKSTDRGETWFNPGTGPGIQNVTVIALTVSPADASIVLAGGVTEGGAGMLFRSTDGGATWTQVLTLDDGVTDVTFATAELGLLTAGTVGSPAAGVWRSADGGVTWEQTSDDEFANLVANAVLVNPLDPQIVYVGTEDQGVVRSTDGGVSWSLLSQGLDARSVHSLGITREAPQTLFAGTDDGLSAFTIAERPVTEPTVTLAPSRALPGEQIRVRAAGFEQAAGQTLCIGISGPAQNFGFNISPARHMQLAMITITETGQGEQAVTLPGDLAAGPFDVVVGPCETRRPGLAPLSGPRASLAIGAVTRYFADGSTQPEFDTWYLLLNPHSEPVQATLTLITGDGRALAFTRELPPTSRTSILADELAQQQIDVLGSAPLSARVDALQRIFVERAMYFGPDGHAVPSLPAPTRRWFFSEGVSVDPFQTWLLVLNPNPEPAQVTFIFQLEGGATRTHTATVGPTTRFTLFANQLVPDAAFATTVESSLPVLAERTVLLGPLGSPIGGHGAAGASEPSTLWVFGEGSTQPSQPPGAMPGVETFQDFRTFVLLQNPNPSPVTATIRLLLDDGGEQVVGPLTIPATARLTFNANVALPDEAFGIRVEASQPIVAERAMYFGPGGAAAHDTLGALAPAHRWEFAEGSTAAPFETWLLLANPNPEPVQPTVTFVSEDGQEVVLTPTVPADGRATIFANLFLPNTAGVSMRVDSPLPIVAERSIYFNQRRGGTNAVGIVPS